MAETRAVSGVGIIRRPGLQPQVAGKRHNKHIHEVRAACAGKVSVGKSDYRAVGIVVARAAVPTFETGIWAELHHTHRHGGTGESVAVATGADERIHIITRVGAGRLAIRTGRGRHSQQQPYSNLNKRYIRFHNCNY